MILLALLLSAIGVADLVRANGRGRGVLPVLAGALVAVAGILVCAVDWWWAPIAVVLLMLWLGATSDRRPDAAGYWAIGGLGAVTAVACLSVVDLPAATGGITDWYDALPYRLTTDVALETVALAIGGVLFLLESANVVVRLALRGTGSLVASPESGPARTPSGGVSGADATDAAAATTQALAPRRRWGRRGRPVPPPEPHSSLKGGRIIGPLERLFLLTLALTGQFTAIAAVIAAKGIIRFPEISKDESGGSKAEYFLVGSFASWTLVLVVGLLVALTVPT